MGKFSFIRLRLLLVPFFGVVFYFSMLVISSFNLRDEYNNVEWTEHVTAIVYCMLFIGILSEGSIVISRTLDRWLDWDKHALYRFLLQISLQALYSGLTFVVLWHLISYLEGTLDEELNELQTRQVMVLSTAITFLVTAVYTGMLFFQKWKKSLVESERMRRESVQAQFEVLKNQVDPHFLFNTLSTLTTVIAENQALAIEFVEQMSLVYRYILQMKEQQSVELGTELEFAQAYVFLLKMRFGNNFSVRWHVPEACHSLRVAPLTLQLLIENAVKHNVISGESPLCIRVEVEAGKRLVVTNNLQRKLTSEPSTRLGLRHLQSRYGLLTGVAPQIHATGSEFVVKMPLLGATDTEAYERTNH